LADLGYISWFEPLSLPVRQVPGLPAVEQLAFARGFYPLPAPYLPSWFEALSEPRRYPPILIPGQQRFDFRPIAAPPISAPGVPIDLYGTPVATSINVFWTPGGGDAWTSFTLQWRLLGASSWNTVTGILTTSYVITGLTADTSYQIQVEALNTAGASAFAGPITVTTLTPPSPVQVPTLGAWRGVCGINWLGFALVGDGFSNVLGRSDFANFTEYGNTMRLLVTSPPIQGNRYRMFIRKFEVEVQAGVGDTAAPNPQMMLDYSRDAGETFGPLIIWRSMGVTGDYTARLRWLSLGSSREWVLRLTCTDPVRRAIIGTYLDAKEGTG
jgi:hypothetical protein